MRPLMKIAGTVDIKRLSTLVLARLFLDLLIFMFTKSNHTSNYLRKWLVFLYFISTAMVMLLIFYLESGYREKNAANRQLILLEKPQGERLLDLKDFRYVINNRVCGENKKKVLAVVIVTSYAGDIEMRNTIRRAYPARILSKFGVRRIFLLALIDDKRNPNRVSQNLIAEESEKFNDILQGNFYEGYRNLTYKHVMGLQWVSKYCRQAKYVIKMDHDIIFDFYRLNFLLKKLPPGNLLLAGYVMNHMKPMRDPKNKWYVTSKEYSRMSYPNFLSGWLYITNPQTAKYLCELSKDMPYFWIDDLYVTGLLVEKTNISFVRLNRYYTTHPEYLQCCIDKPNFICDYLIGPIGNDNKLMIQFQKYSEHCFYKICKKRGENNSLKSTCIAKWKDEPFGKGRAIVDLITLS